MPQLIAKSVYESKLTHPLAILWGRRCGRTTLQLAIILLGLLFLLSGNASVGAEPLSGQIELTRNAAVAMAIGKNINLRIDALNTALAKTNLARSRGLYDPILTSTVKTGETTYPNETFRTNSTYASLGITRYLPTGGSISASTQSGYTTAESDNPSISTRDWQASLGLTITQPLLKNFGKENMEFSITLADNTLQGSLERFRFVLADTVFTVITSYNRLYSLRQALSSRQAAFDSAQQLLQQLKQGPNRSAKKVEIANTEYAITKRMRDLVDAQRRVSDQEAYVRFLIGMEENKHLIPTDPPSRQEPLESEQEAIKIALESRSDLKQLRLNLESAQLEERVAHRKVLPDLSLSASGGYSGIANDFGGSYQQIGDGEGGWWSAGLTFTLPLGNTSAKNNYRRARYQAEQVQQRIRAFEWQVRNGIEADMRSLISARLQLQNAEQSLHFAEERYNEYGKHRQAGTGTVQNLLDAEQDLITARNSRSDAEENFAYSVALLWRDMGVLLERRNIHVDTTHPEQLTRNAEPPDAAKPQLVEKPVPAGAVVSEAQAQASPETSKDQLVPSGQTKGKGPQPLPPQSPTKPSPLKVVASSMQGAGGGRTTAAYQLVIGEFLSKARLAAAEKILHQAGLTPTVRDSGGRKKEVIRLLSGHFSDLTAARKRISELRKVKADPFLLRGKQGAYKVFAGSYFSEAGARRERSRLLARGFKTTLEDVTVTLPSYRLTAGPFSSRDAAKVQGANLEKKGMVAKVEELPDRS